jgi:hypothetical protein
MKLTKFQKRVKDLMDKGFTRSRDIADALGSTGPCAETNVSKAMNAVDEYNNIPQSVTVTLTTKEARALVMALRYLANEPGDTDYAEYKSLKDKFERAFPDL